MKIGFRVWILIIALLLSILAIKPTFESGVLVRSVERNSTYFNAGLRQGEIIKSINGESIADKEAYTAAISKIFVSGLVQKIDIKTKSNEYTLLTNETPQITIDSVPKTRIQTGLDLRGGARALVQPEGAITDAELADLVDASRNRFNVFGLSDVQIRGVSDLSGNKFMLVEVAGATPTDLEDLVSKQGKFEAKLGNNTVFVGGKKDISSVCRNDASCAGITECSLSQAGGYVCGFRFTIYLTEESAQRHAKMTESIPLDSSGQYLSDKLNLFVDDNLVDSLLVSVNLKGQVTTQISIQGSGTGATQEEAFNDAKASMNKLQTVLITGSLPYKLKIVKLDTISPVLGDQFIRLILLAGAASIALVGLIIFIRYRKIKASLALLFTSFSEIMIILGVAALIKWNLDLPSIAGILATIGTGVDAQIVILDEAETGKQTSLVERMKRALFVVITSYATSVVSLLPLYWAGAGLFKGFAITTIIGISAGVFLSRPAFADMIKKIEG